MLNNQLIIATRQSPLALWQAEHIADRLQQLWPELNIKLLPMVTSGDRFLKDKLLTVGGKGLFVKELEEALLHNKADIAVHSMKDMPALYPEGLDVPVITTRDNPYDALISHRHPSLQDLPNAAVVGTSSLRRQSQLLALRPDLRIETLRGNIHTRLEKLSTGAYDAIILAAAGLHRMNLQSKIAQIIPGEIMLPSCGQGALGVECRLDDDRIRSLIMPLQDPITSICVATERKVNALLGGHCHAPIAVYCQVQDTTRLLLRAKVLSPNGQTVLTAMSAGPIETAAELAHSCAEQLFAQGAEPLLTFL